MHYIFQRLCPALLLAAVSASAGEMPSEQLRAYLAASIFQPAPKMRIETRDNLLMRTLTDGKPFPFAPESFKEPKRYLVLEMATGQSGYGLLSFWPNYLRFRVNGDNAYHVYNIDLHQEESSIDYNVPDGLLFIDAPGTDVRIRQLRFSDEPAGPAEVEIAAAGLTEAVNTCGEESEFFINCYNSGTADSGELSIRQLALPSVVRVTTPGEWKKLGTVPARSYRSFSINLTAPRPVRGGFRLQLAGAGAPRAFFRGEIEFTSKTERPKTGYVPEPRPVKSAFEIGAFYFPDRNTPDAWEKLRTVAPERKPLLGYYDAATPENIDWQIKFLAENGFHFLLVNWSWNRGAVGQQRWFEAFDSARYNSCLKWALFWDNETRKDTHSLEEQRNIVRYWLENYFNKPYYYRIDGKPVVAVRKTSTMDRHLGYGGAKQLLDLSQQLARDAGLPGIYFIALENPDDPALNKELSKLKLDGFDMTTICRFASPGSKFPGLVRSTYDYRYVVDSSYEYYMKRNKAGVLPFLPNLSTGWDDFPLRGTAGTAVTNRTPELFLQLCRNAKKFAERTGIRQLVLSPINDWAEGSYAEPNREYQFKLYEAVRDTFAVRPAEGWPPNYGPAEEKQQQEVTLP